MNPVTIGPYTVTELLSKGGFGQVVLAERLFEGGGKDVVAIKTPLAEGILDPRICEAHLAEGRLGMRLKHPNIPEVREVGVHEGTPYFVMTFISGKSLTELIRYLSDRDQRLDYGLIAEIARGIAYALQYAHNFEMEAGVRCPIVHRDVAPKNVLIGGTGGVYVIDFGVAEALNVHKSSKNYVKGTLRYMAPEHAMGFPTPRSDCFSLGAVMWEMIEGRSFRGDVDQGELRRLVNEGWVPPLTRSDIPDDLRFCVEGLLKADEPSRLYLDEVIELLETNYPTRKAHLRRLMRVEFGRDVTRTGGTNNGLPVPDEVLHTMEVARVASDRQRSRSDHEMSDEPPPGAEAATRRLGRPRAMGPADDVDLATRREPQSGDSVPKATMDPPPRFEPPPVVSPAGVHATERLPRPLAASSSDRRLVEREPTEMLPAPDGRRAERDAVPVVRKVVRTELAVASSVPAVGNKHHPMDGVPVARQAAQTEVAAAPFVPAERATTDPMPAATPWPPARPPMYTRPRDRSRAVKRGVLVGTLLAAGVFAVVGTWWQPEPAETAPQPDFVASTNPATETRDASIESLDADRPRPTPVASVSGEQTATEPTVTAPAPEPIVSPAPTATITNGEAVPTPSTEPPATVTEAPAPEAEPVEAQPSKKPSKPVPTCSVRVALGFVESMEIEIAGIRRTLTTKVTPDATLRPRAGRVKVRWRAPGQPWHSRTETLVPGVDYHVFLAASGPKFSKQGASK